MNLETFNPGWVVVGLSVAGVLVNLGMNLAGMTWLTKSWERERQRVDELQRENTKLATQLAGVQAVCPYCHHENAQD